MHVSFCPIQREPVPDDYSRVDPEHKLIYRFVRTLFSAAQLTAECAIVTLVSGCLAYTNIFDRWILTGFWCKIGPVLLAQCIGTNRACFKDALVYNVLDINTIVLKFHKTLFKLDLIKVQSSLEHKLSCVFI